MANNNAFSRVSSFIDNAVEDKLIPGVALAVTSPEKTLYQHCYGLAHKDKEIKVTADTIFDLASLTKVVTTLPSVLKLMEEGQLDLDDRVYYYLSDFKEYNRDLTIKHLLTHTSGYQPGIKFYSKDLTMKESVTLISKLTDKKKAGIEVIYSDLNFIVLGYLVQKVSGMSLEKYAEKEIYQPLHMQDTCFNPSKSKKERIAATEYVEILKDYRWGAVHDENANHFNGVSGHAGLFSTIEDTSKFSRMILNGKRQNVLSKRTIELSRQSMTRELNLNRGLGWQLYDIPSASGQFMQNGFGHTGFTGTSIWFEPNGKYAVILLTNRVHFGRETDIGRFRRIIHNLVALGVDD